MGDKTEISWADHTFNPWVGCTKVSPACANCYAERQQDHWLKKVKWGPQGQRVRTSDATWSKPLKWNREAQATGVRRRVFCASLADVFEDWDQPIQDSKGERLLVCDGCGRLHPDTDPYASCECTRFLQRCEWAKLSDLRHALFALIDSTPWLDWMLLTKRPENIRRMWPMKADKRAIFPGAPGGLGEPIDCLVEGAYRDNVWLGSSVENQEYTDKRIPELSGCRSLARVLFLSCEPLLGSVDLGQHRESIDWVITGGESGPNARPSHPDWFLGLRDQCYAAGIAYHHKQNGEWIHSTQTIANDDRADQCYTHIAVGDGTLFTRVGVEAAGRLLDGREHLGFPNRKEAATR